MTATAFELNDLLRLLHRALEVEDLVERAGREEQHDQAVADEQDQDLRHCHRPGFRSVGIVTLRSSGSH